MCILKSEELEYVSEKPKLTNWVTSEAIRGQNHFFVLQGTEIVCYVDKMCISKEKGVK